MLPRMIFAEARYSEERSGSCKTKARKAPVPDALEITRTSNLGLRDR